jgi:hypothetical protein
MATLDRRAERVFETLDRDPALHGRGLGCLSLRMLDWIAGDFLRPHISLMAITRYGKEPARLEGSFEAFFSSEKCSRVRTDSSMEELQPFLEQSIRALHEEYGEPFLLCYESSREVERIARRYPGVRIMNPSAVLTELLNRKTWVRRQLARAGIPVIPGSEVRLSADACGPLAERYGLPLVVSLDASAAGSGVHLIRDAADFRAFAEAHAGAAASVMRYIDGRSLSIAAVSTADHVLLGEPSLQVIGQPGLTNYDFGWCGNDFSGSLLQPHEIEAMRGLQERIGRWLGSLRVGGLEGFHGFFGVDYVSDGRDVFVTEINPRFLGTTALMADRQRELGRIPLSFLHLVPFLPDVRLEPDFVADYNRPRATLDVSQLCLHNVADEDVVVAAAPEPGRYILDEGGLRYLGPADALSQTLLPDEFVIGGEIPVEGTHLLRKSDEICKVFTYRPVLGPDGRGLNPHARRLVEAVRATFSLQPQWR